MNLSAIFCAFLIALSIGTAPPALAAKNCKKGKPCGNACISKEDVCHKPTLGEATEVHGAAPTTADEPAAAHINAVTAPSADAPTAQSEATQANIATTGKVTICKKGKPCGSSCIAEKATCHANE